MEGSLDPSVKDLLHYHKQGTEYIKKALSIDETSDNKDEAVSFYKRGIEEFLLGLSITIKGDSRERGCHIQDKMESNLNMALDRVEELKQASPRMQHLKDKIERVRQERLKSLKPSSKAVDTPKSIPTSNSVRRVEVSNDSTSGPRTSASSHIKPKQPTTRPTATGTRGCPPSTSRPSSTTIAKKPSATSNANRQQPTATNSKTSIGKKLKIPNVDDRLIEFILDEIVDSGHTVQFDHIAGQEKAKQALNELVILPALNPELFTGLRSPVKGLLLFGPPGNGKTMLAKAVASEANCKFFNITAASLTSKYVGEGEKLVRALFALAAYIQPAIIFIDEIDSLLFERKENDHEASRRLKTEFLTQFDGVQTNSQDRILVMGATNRPFELDNAALRRFPKRIYIGLPDRATRMSMITKLLANQAHSLRSYQLDDLARLTEGYSGSDLTALAKDASLGPIREQSVERLKTISASSIRPVSFEDFRNAIQKIRPSVPKSGLSELEKWNRDYGDINN